MTKEISISAGDLLIRYSKSPAIRALVQLIPLGLGGAADTFVATRVERIKVSRAQTFFDELSKGKIELTEDLIKSEDFLHCFYISSKAALNTRRHEKIKLFAKLLKSSVGENPPKDTDDFEDLLSILDELTYTEWQALLILDRYTKSPRDKNQNDLQWSITFWGRFKIDVLNELKIPPGEFTSFMNRMSRTGLYEQFVGGFMDYVGGVGMLTPKFFRLKKYVFDFE